MAGHVWRAMLPWGCARRAAACTNSCTKAILRRNSIPLRNLRAAIPTNTAWPPYFTAWSAARARFRQHSGQMSDSNPRAKTLEPSVPVYVSEALQMGLRLKPAERIQTVPLLMEALSSPEKTDELARSLRSIPEEGEAGAKNRPWAETLGADHIDQHFAFAGGADGADLVEHAGPSFCIGDPSCIVSQHPRKRTPLQVNNTAKKSGAQPGGHLLCAGAEPSGVY